MVEPKDTVPKEVNGYILLLTPSTYRAEESDGKSKSKRVCKYLGFEGKKLWDWLDLLLAPFLVSFLLLWIGRYFEGRAKTKEEDFNSERNKQEILRNYLTTMTNLISEGKLNAQLNDNNKIQPTNQAAKALTQSALTSFDQAVLPPKLRDVVRDVEKRVLMTEKELDAWVKSEADANRKRQVLQFLNDAQLINKGSPTIDMAGIDLQAANLSHFKLTPIMEKNQLHYIPINLKKANLYGANLYDAQMEAADMTGIQLEKAQLETANLKDAKLRDANLRDANLQGANLQGVDLNHADLTGANLTKANLTYSREDKKDEKTLDIKLIGANLTGAKLTGANLKYADLNNAILTDADFRDAQGMDTADMTGATFCKTTMPEGTVRSDSCFGQAK